MYNFVTRRKKTLINCQKSNKNVSAKMLVLLNKCDILALGKQSIDELLFTH